MIIIIIRDSSAAVKGIGLELLYYYWAPCHDN